MSCLALNASFEPLTIVTTRRAVRLVLDGKAEVGLGLRAVAKQLRLDFLPLTTERFDLVLRRRDYFEPPFQKLLAFARRDAFRVHAIELGGYDISGLGQVRYNAP